MGVLFTHVLASFHVPVGTATAAPPLSECFFHVLETQENQTSAGRITKNIGIPAS